jgi:Ca2+-transporting ATPase
MFLLLLACSGAYLLLGEVLEAALLMGFVVLLILMTVWQSLRTGKALQALQDLQVPMADVERAGGNLRIPASELHLGDVLVLSPGDRVAADAVLLEGHVAVDESMFTGESVLAEKYPDIAVLNYDFGIAGGNGEERAQLRAGSFVMRGRARARVVAQGLQSSLGQLQTLVAGTTEQDSALQQSARKLAHTIGVLALVLCVVQFGVGAFWYQQALLPALLSGLTVGMASLPEEVPVIMMVFMAMGAWRMARSQVLTRRLGALEALGTVSVVAVDKTGTLTENRMRLAGAATVSQQVQWHDGQFQGLGEDADNGKSGVGLADLLPGMRAETLVDLIQCARLATPEGSLDAIDQAVAQAAAQFVPSSERSGGDGRTGDHNTTGWGVAVQHLEMSSELPVMGQVYRSADARFMVCCKGAPECVFDLCALPPQERLNWTHRLDVMAQCGWRVLAVARSRPQTGAWLKSDQDGWASVRRNARFELIGLLGFFDPPRPSARHAIEALHKAGIRTMMLTGDHPQTALAVAHSVGLSPSRSVLLGGEIEEMSDEALAIALRTCDVCARVTPRQKLRVIASLQLAGSVVAMTGDGVNDAPALKAADVGVAMGKRGCDLARQTAAVVLLDDDFAHMVSAISQGRQIFNKIHKTSRFVVAVHVPLLLLVLMPGLLNQPALLLPVHVLVFEIIINPACSVVFEAEPPDPALMHRPPLPKGASPFGKNVLMLGAVQGCILLAGALLALAVVQHLGASILMQRSLVLLMLVMFVLQMGLLSLPDDPHRQRSPVWMWFVGVVCLLILALFGSPLSLRLFEMERPDSGVLIVLAGLAVLTTLCLRWLERARRMLNTPAWGSPR